MKNFVLLIAMLSVLNLSCIHHKQPVKTPVRKPDKVRVKEGARVEDAATKYKVKTLVLTGDYIGALELIKKAVESGRPKSSYVKECADSINGLADKGIRNFSDERYGSAGMVFRKVIENYPSDRELRAEIRYSEEEAKTYLETSSRKLMEQGLLEYRKGNLGQAISIWGEIVRFNPGYMNVEKMIDTAIIQFENLEALDAVE